MFLRWAAAAAALACAAASRAQDLTPACAAEVRLLLKLAGPPENSMPLWTLKQDAPPRYLRNPGVWTGSLVDLTGKAVWTSYAGGFGATAISPLHIVYADHAKGLYPPGTVVRFVTNDDRVIERRVAASIAIGRTDIDLSTLDAPLPPSIHWYKVMPPRWFLTCSRRTADGKGGLPCLVLDDNTQSVALKEFAGFTLQGFFTMVPPGVERRFTRELRGGDSGSPLFLLVGRELVLEGIYHWTVGGPELGSSINELNTAMQGSGYQVTVLQLGGSRPGA